MTQQISHSARTSELRAPAYPTPGSDEPTAVAQSSRQLETLHIPVGTNLADVERWMIFATLQKCGGNKTRAAALLGVSLKTLYNRLNAYRIQGLAMDYDRSGDDRDDDGRNGNHAGRNAQDSVEITDLHGELTEVPL